MKALYALVFVLFSFAAPAQTLETSIAAYHLDDLDCSGETTQQSAVSTQIVATEPTIEKPGEATRNQAGDVVATGPNDAEIPVGAIQPGDENAIAAYSSRSDDQLTDDTSEQSAMPAQIIATGPALEKLGEAKPTETKPTETKPTETDGVATTEPNDAKDAPVEATQPSDESSTVKHSTLRDDKPTVDDTSEQSAMPAQIIATGPTLEKLGEAKPTETKPTETDGVATTEPNDAKDAPVEATQPGDESSTAKHSTLRDDKPTVDDTSEQSAMPAQIIATGPVLEKLGEAKLIEADDVATTAPNDAEDAPVEATQPSDESSTAKHSTLSDDKPTVDDTSEQSAMPAQIIATGPTLEKLGEAEATEAKPTETDGVATTAPNDAEDAPVRAIQPNL